MWIFYLFAIIYLITAITGIYICSNKQLKQDVDFKDVWQFFLLMIVLRLCDVISTIYFASHLTAEAEMNVLAKLFMTDIGIVPGIIMLFLISMPMIYLWLINVNYLLDKKYWGLFKIILTIVSIIIPIYNMSL